MRIRQNTYFLSFINILQTPKYWCDFFKKQEASWYDGYTVYH